MPLSVSNPYDSLVPQAMPADIANPYDDLVAAPRNAARANVSQSALGNPATIASQRALAKYVGLPGGVADAIPEEIKRMAAVKRVDEDIAGNPALQRAYADPAFADIAHDDSTVLGSIGKAIGMAAAYTMGATPTGGFVGTLKAMPEHTVATFAGIKRAAMDVLGAPGKAITGRENWFTEMAQFYAQQSQAAEEAAKRIDSPMSDIVGGGLASGVQSFAQNAKYIPLALTGPLGASVALGGMVAETFGQSYNKAADKGLPLWQKLTYGASDAAVEFWTERAPLFNLIHNIKVGTPLAQTILKNAWQENKGEQIATVLQDANEWATLNPERSLGDYLRDRPAAAVQTLLATLVGAGGNVALMHSVQSAADQMTGNTAEARYAQYQADQLTAILAKASESQTRTRDPQTFASVVQQMAEETPGAPTHVYIDAGQLQEIIGASTEDMGVLNQLMPNIAEQLKDATPSTAIELPIGELAAHIAGTPLEAALMPHLRIGDENALSQTEAKQAETEQAALIQEHIDRIVGNATKGEQIRTEAEQIASNISSQITATGMHTKEQADLMALPVKAFYVATAAKYGVSPKQVFADNPISVQNGKDGGATVQQMTPEQKTQVVELRKREAVLKQLVECMA